MKATRCPSLPRTATAARDALAVALLLSLIAPRAAHAYLDPATGSMVLQGLVGGVMAGLFVLRRQWGRVKALFTRGRSEVEAPEPARRDGDAE